jgi:hypothetical protein
MQPRITKTVALGLRMRSETAKEPTAAKTEISMLASF